MEEPGPPPGARVQCAAIYAGVKAYVRRDLPRLVLYSVVGFFVGALANASILALRYQGYLNVPPGAPATGQGNVVYASIVWAIASGLVFGMVAYRRQVGGERFWRDIRGFPASLAGYVRDDGPRAVIRVLWGLAGTLLVVQLLSSTLSALLGAVLVVSLSKVVRPVITGVVMAVYRGIGRRLAPSSGVPGTVAMVVGLLGSVGAMVVGALVPAQPIKLGIAIVAALAAFALSRVRRAPTPAMAMLLLGLLAALAAGFRAHPVLAHDGGFVECLHGPFGCGLLGLLNQSIFGGTATAAGGGLGSMLGDGAAQVAKSTETPEETMRRWYRQWRQKYPHGTHQDFMDWFHQTGVGVHWSRQYTLDHIGWMAANEFIESLGADFASGEIENRLGTLAEKGWGHFKEEVTKGVINPLKVAAEFWRSDDKAKGFATMGGGAKEALVTSLDFYKSLGFEGTMRELYKAGYEVSAETTQMVMSKMDELERAVGMGDTARAVDMISDLSANAMFQVLMARAPEVAIGRLGEVAVAYNKSRVARGLAAVAEEPRPVPPRARGLTRADEEYLRANDTAGRANILYARDGTRFGLDELEPAGWDKPRMTAAAEIAEENKCTVVLKSGQPEANLRQAEGALPKPEDCPPKSWDPMDRLVRPGEHREGYVLNSEPVKPTKPDGMSDAAWRDLKPQADAFYEKRVKQFNDAQPHMLKAREEGMTFVVNGKEVKLPCGWEGGGTYKGKNFGDGVVYGVVPEDASAEVRQALGEPGTRVPVAGDNDAFTVLSDARKTPDGRYLPDSAFRAEDLKRIRAEEKAVQRQMQDRIPGVNHEGDTPNYVPPAGKENTIGAIMHGTSSDNPIAENLIFVGSDRTATVGTWPGKPK